MVPIAEGTIRPKNKEGTRAFLFSSRAPDTNHGVRRTATDGYFTTRRALGGIRPRRTPKQRARQQQPRQRTATATNGQDDENERQRKRTATATNGHDDDRPNLYNAGTENCQGPKSGSGSVSIQQRNNIVETPGFLTDPCGHSGSSF